MLFKTLNIPENKRKAIEEFVRVLKEWYGDRVKRVILFGSVARSDFSEESDIDVLVIADGISTRDVVRAAHKILLDYGEVIVPILKSSEEFARYKHHSFYRTVSREGVIIA